MKYLNAKEYKNLKEKSDAKNDGFEKVEFKVNVYATNTVTGEEKEEAFVFSNAEKFLNDSGDEVFVCYDEFHDGYPRWAAFSKKELIGEDYKLIEKTSIKNEKEKVEKREKEIAEKRKEAEEERIKQAQLNYEKNKKAYDARIKEEKESALRKREGKVADFVKENGYGLEVISLDEDNKKLVARMYDKGNNTLANFKCNLVKTTEYVDDDFTYEIDDEKIVSYFVDIDDVKVTDKNGNELDDEGQIYVCIQALGEFLFWENKDYDLLNSYHLIDNNKYINRNFDLQDKHFPFEKISELKESEMINRMIKKKEESKLKIK